MQQQYFLGTMLKKRYTSRNGFIYPNYTRVEVSIICCIVHIIIMTNYYCSIIIIAENIYNSGAKVMCGGACAAFYTSLYRAT